MAKFILKSALKRMVSAALPGNHCANAATHLHLSGRGKFLSCKFKIKFKLALHKKKLHDEQKILTP